MPSSKDPAATQEFKISARPGGRPLDRGLGDGTGEFGMLARPSTETDFPGSVMCKRLNLGLARVPGRDDTGTARFHRNAVLSLPVIASRDHLHDPAKRKEMKW